MNADKPNLPFSSRRSVWRTLTQAVALQAVVYAVIAYVGPCRSVPAAERPAANRRHVLEWLPSHRRDVIEQVLAGWQQEYLSNKTASPFGTQYEQNYPGSYQMRYTKGDRASIVIVYSAANERLATRYTDAK